MLTILAILLLSFGGAAAACAHQALALSAANDHNSAHHADCPGNPARGDVAAAVADTLCDCAQPTAVDTTAKPMPVAVLAADVDWTTPAFFHHSVDVAQAFSFHGPPWLYLLTGRLRL